MESIGRVLGAVLMIMLVLCMCSLLVTATASIIVRWIW